MAGYAGKIEPALARVQHHGAEQMHVPDPPPPPDISWPVQCGTLASFAVSEVFAEVGFVCFHDPCKGVASRSVTLSDYLATDISGQNVMLATQPKHLAKALQYYLDTKSKSDKEMSLCVLVQANHTLFAKWRPYVVGMKRIPCPGWPPWLCVLARNIRFF